ncbi:cation:dicarboxylate symporter family transporter [Fusobacterium mortiferum]|uniref:Cation:dicarboxylase symporter family transporter n=2 Tax=Fusobacterium TaxID=848 RepID=A0ABS2G1K5_FUSMR|nr:cation:dicarboxylase symporter family transporter [Fusobacterium mortiferum]MBM6689595.1 cation:dicarboxylase symporter family transporter [Fusobacterium mortiferum]MBM6821375.1 cation:dicarboxylase symporter family transporter [Fusobacterium mortiferum]MBM6875296.1 cation:dicarboxylase symporter family transporter [Fusobacterium mortiferum]MBU3842659.1 cation:dicarboxylase symporter family transporter [Candidatus Fusobacterium pullicola]
MNSVFFKQFLMISDIKTIIFLIALVAIIMVINRLPKEKFNFSAKVMTATFIGLILGLVIQVVAGFPHDPMKLTFVRETTLWYSLLGGGFISLIRMLVIPLVMVSIIHVIINMKEDANLGSLVKRTLTISLAMVAISVAVGLVFGILFKVGKFDEATSVITEGGRQIREVKNIVDTLKALIPSNPVEAMVNLNIVGLVIFSSIVGVAAKRMSKKYMAIVKPFFDLINAFQKIIVSMAMSIIKWMPAAVVPLLANTIAQKGVHAIAEVGKFIVVLYLAVAVMFVVQMIAVAVFGMNPFTYVKKCTSLLLLAFTSRSSVGCLPVTISTLTNKLGVTESTASFVGSFGTTAGMQGCAGIFPALTIVFVTHMSGHSIDMTMFAMAIIVVAISSLGIAGIPGTATMAASVGLSGTGLAALFPLINPILAIDPIIDMPRTMLNVIGSVTNALMVDKSLGLINMNTYNDPNAGNEASSAEME